MPTPRNRLQSLDDTPLWPQHLTYYATHNTLNGNRKGQYSIRVNDQWRICFRWKDGDIFDVEIVDYH